MAAEPPGTTTTTHIWMGDEIQVDKIVKKYYIIEVTESEDGELIEEPVLVTEIDTVEYLHGLKLIESDYGTYLYNAHGDVTAIVGMIEPQLGGDEVFGIIASYDYDPFGMPPVARSLIRDIDMADEIMNGFGGNQLMGRAGDDAAGLRINRADDNNPFRYCGEYLDIETGYIYLRARYYDPSIGRFISEDSAHDGLNWYAYCYNNPIAFTDSTGMSPFWDTVKKVAIGAAMVVGTALFVAAIVASAGTVGALAGVGAAALGFSAGTVATIASVATVGTYVVAAGVGAFGLSDATEVWTGGTNPIRDYAMGGNQTAYNVTRGVFNTLGTVATIAGAIGPKILQNVAKKYGIPSREGHVINFKDRGGNWNARIDATVHGNPKPPWHHNPHVHFEDIGGKGKPVYYIWEVIRRLLGL